MVDGIKKIAGRFTVALIILCFSPVHSSQRNTSMDLLDKMFLAVTKIHTARYSLTSYERVKNKPLTASSQVKLQISPRKVYLKNTIKGIEVLWVQGKNKGYAWVNPGSFPFLTLHLDPEGELMTKSQHHTIHQLGFGYFSEVIQKTIASIGQVAYKNITVLGDVEWDNKLCHKVYIDFSDYYKMQPYTVGKNEDLKSLSNKLHLSKFIIRDNNPNRKIKQGETINIPSIYASKIILYVDKKSTLPIYLKVIDNGGLYESYEFSDVKINSTITEEEFTTTYKDYKF